MFCDDTENAEYLQSKEISREGGGKSKKQEPGWRTQRSTVVATMWRALNSTLVRCQENGLTHLWLKDWSIFSVVGYNFAKLFFTGVCKKSSPCMEMSACFLVAYLGKKSQLLAGVEKFRSSHGRKIKAPSSHGNHTWVGFFPSIAKKKVGPWNLTA